MNVVFIMLWFKNALYTAHKNVSIFWYGWTGINKKISWKKKKMKMHLKLCINAQFFVQAWFSWMKKNVFQKSVAWVLLWIRL